MSNEKISIQIIYRNYKNLHPIYNTLLTNPPSQIRYLYANPTSNIFMKVGFRFYRAFKKYDLISKLIDRSQKLFFSTKTSNEADLIEYIQFIPENFPKQNYIIDVEHASGLFNFTKPTESTRIKVVKFLSNKKCKGIICTSQIAIKTFKEYFTEEELKTFNNKVYLNYPALPLFAEIFNNQEDHTYLKNNGMIKLLFVGNDVYRKGLHELLEAFTILNDKELELHIISNADSELRSKYRHDNIYYYSPSFNHSEVIKKFFLPADIFILPTHFDTFGMVLLDALSSGTPAITTRQFAIPEIIRHGENGILIDSDTLYLNDKDKVTTKHYGNKFSKESEKKVVDQIINSIDLLSNNPEVLEKMKQNTILDFKVRGKFSIEKRNNNLKEIYNRAIL